MKTALSESISGLHHLAQHLQQEIVRVRDQEGFDIPGNTYELLRSASVDATNLYVKLNEARSWSDGTSAVKATNLYDRNFDCEDCGTRITPQDIACYEAGGAPRGSVPRCCEQCAEED